MPTKYLLSALCLACALAFAQDRAGGKPPQNPPPAAQTQQVSLATPVVTIGATAAKRGDSVTLSIPSVAEVTGAKATLAGRPVEVDAQGSTLTMKVPADQPLGPADVLITLPKHEYPAKNTLNVVASTVSPGIDGMRLSPPAPVEGRVSIDIFGHGFSTAVLTFPNDIQLLVDHTPRQVHWVAQDQLDAQCRKAAGEHMKDEAALVPIYGSVISESQIRVCNVPATNGILPVGIRQGEDLPSKAESLVVSDWNTALVRGIAGGAALLLIGLVYLLLSFKGEHIVRNRRYRMKAMILDKQTNTYSLSILQFHMWTAATLFGYTYFALSRLFVQRGGIIADVPGGVPGIVGIGIGAGTAVAAQLIQGVNPKGAGEETPSPSDLVTSGGAIAPDRVQMLVWTFIAVGMFIAAVLAQAPSKIQGLPEIPTTLMQLMGLSSLGYLGGKFARKPGPNILELSIIPATALPAGGCLTTVAPVDVTEPKSKATQALDALKRISTGLVEASAPAAVREANSAVSTLESAVAAAAAVGGSAGVPKLIQLTDAAHNAAVNAASEFDRASSTPGSEIARVSANVAQRAAVAVQDLTEGVSALVAAAETSASRRATEEAQAFRRTIEIRGSNLSAEGIFRAKIGTQDYDIPFRMLEEKDGVRAPVIVVPEENSGNAKFARTLQLNIVPATLDPADKKTYDAVFGNANPDVQLTIFNPDGQKASKSFAMPPGEAQRP
jgi:hypothetical protein